MKNPAFSLTFAVMLIVAASAGAWPIQEDEAKYQSQNFKQWWGTDLVWKFDDLPVDGTVPKYRYPYSGAIYPDNAGGTAYVLRKYDQAFHRGRRLAETFEYHDIEVHKEQGVRRGGLFGRRVFHVHSTPHWAGHCNGWAAAAIRHAEPQNNVVRNGVAFTPADIKAMLAELYTYTDIEHLGGVDPEINPGTLHVVLSNWIGKQEYPIAMDSSVGKEVWNFPVYAYRSSSKKHNPRQVEVKVNIGYVNYTNREYNRGPRNFRYQYFHYRLDLDEDGHIVGGSYYGDSNRIDMLWVPLKPTPGGQEGNESGNPYLDVDTVLSLWRESAPAELRKKWFTVDPAEEDLVLWDNPAGEAQPSGSEEEPEDSENPEDQQSQADDSSSEEDPASEENATQDQGDEADEATADGAEAAAEEGASAADDDLVPEEDSQAEADADTENEPATEDDSATEEDSAAEEDSAPEATPSDEEVDVELPMALGG